MTTGRSVGAAREVALTIGAVVGVLCLVSTAAAVLLDVTPLIFRSGSMAPSIRTGDLAIARTVPAGDVRRGDVVSVVGASGVRVTHRVVSVEGDGPQRRLVLKGDDNRAPDDEEHTVTSVDRVVFHVPRAGYVADAVTGPVGLLAVGAYSALLLAFALRRGSGRGGPDGGPTSRVGRRRRDAPRGTRSATRATALVLCAAAASTSAPAVAAPWTDTATVGAPTLSAYRVAAPASLTCSGGGVLASLTYTWPNTDLRHQYVATLEDSTGTVRRTDVVANSGSLATSQSTTYSFTLLNGIVGVPASITVRVRARLAGSPSWVSVASVTAPGSLLSLGLAGVASSCT